MAISHKLESRLIFFSFLSLSSYLVCWKAIALLQCDTSLYVIGFNSAFPGLFSYALRVTDI